MREWGNKIIQITVLHIKGTYTGHTLGDDDDEKTENNYLTWFNVFFYTNRNIKQKTTIDFFLGRAYSYTV